MGLYRNYRDLELRFEPGSHGPRLRRIHVTARDFRLTQTYKRNLKKMPWLEDL